MKEILINVLKKIKFIVLFPVRVIKKVVLTFIAYYKIFKTNKLYHSICLLLILVCLAFSFFRFQESFARIGESCRDLVHSIGYYFAKLFNLKYDIKPTVIELPKLLPEAPPVFIPGTYEGFKEQLTAYVSALRDKQNFNSYMFYCQMLFTNIAKLILICVPFFLILKILFRRALRKENNDYNEDSKQLKRYKALLKCTYEPLKAFLSDFISFVSKYRRYASIWLVVWLFNFNIFTMIAEAIAFYLYFIVSFDTSNMYLQVYKLFIDIKPMISFIPFWVWLVLLAVSFDRFRKRVGYSTLSKYEKRNRKYIKSTPVSYYTAGSMGTGKTQKLTDMALSLAVEYREEALKLMMKNDLKFPDFPWINFENKIKKAMKKHDIFNLATCEKFVKEEHAAFEIAIRACKKSNIFDYDYERYGLIYDDKLKLVKLWKVLENYAKEYFIYTVSSSLIVSNYSIRADNIKKDKGNFPIWNTNFFKRDSRLIKEQSLFAHIMDFDALRLGKKVLKNNRKANSLEFGIFVITEAAKERGNQYDTKEIKASAEEANRLNDGFDKNLKMIRHKATVDNFCFVKVLFDEQRPESMGANVRDLCKVVHIRDKMQPKLAMPFFFLGDLIYNYIERNFQDLYYEYRYNRGDNTLFLYLIKSVVSKFFSYRNRIYNIFSYEKLVLEIEDGTLDSRYTDAGYYLMSKKIHAERYDTACLSGFFTKKALNSDMGIGDLETYQSVTATDEELDLQNSHFIGDMRKYD